jgi:hypothetical protein
MQSLGGDAIVTVLGRKSSSPSSSPLALSSTRRYDSRYDVISAGSASPYGACRQRPEVHVHRRCSSGSPITARCCQCTLSASALCVKPETETADNGTDDTGGGGSETGSSRQSHDHVTRSISSVSISGLPLPPSVGGTSGCQSRDDT